MESNAAPLYNQSVYCSGGDKEGYDRSNFVQGILNVQTFYCSGGNRDGYGSADTLHGPFNDQSFYCSSNDGDGFSRSYLAPAQFFDQSIYCSGGNSLVDYFWYWVAFQRDSVFGSIVDHVHDAQLLVV